MKGKGTKVERNDVLEAEVDAFFKLPLAEFTGARNALAARLKKSGRGGDSNLVKALIKPSISAWAVNQLYWHHRKAFDGLIASGESFHKAQTSRPAGKAVDMRAALDARREALAELSELATALLRDAGHSSTPETIHRITTTLEGLSANAARADAPSAGRLTQDVDPPGFELFGSSIPGAGMGTQDVGKQAADGGKQARGKLLRVTGSQGPSVAFTNTPRKAAADDALKKREEARRANVAAGKVSLQDAKRSLTEARAKLQSLETAQKKAETESTVAEKNMRDAEERLEKATEASRDAARRARSVAREMEYAARALKDAESTVAKRSRELEKLFGG